ncbi:hypothetical protein [Desulfosediminicola sp.]|uniref:hypothetical protein n=1 Tax=Desulfosediminicola sp. TaxID=2886825 RepID=UPI003AF29124
MGKPKENTIEKIDNLNSRLTGSGISEPKKELIAALAERCHSMNINKAKLAYFKEIKLLLTKCLAAVESGKITEEAQWLSLEKELLRLLHAKNG